MKLGESLTEVKSTTNFLESRLAFLCKIIGRFSNLESKDERSGSIKGVEVINMGEFVDIN